MIGAASEIKLHLRHVWLIWLGGFLYTLSLHKYVVRDPLSQANSIQGLLEFVLTLAALMFVLIALRQMAPISLPSPALLCFAVFGLFALASSWRSFNPPLSLAKGFLFFAVLLIGYVAGQTGYLTRFFQSIYWTFTGTLIIGVLLGLAMPTRFPLWMTDAFTGRSRFSVFGTFPGTMGETASYLILLSPLIFRRSRWLSRSLLLLTNLLAGGKTSTALLLTLLAIEYVLEIRKARSWRAITFVGAVTCGFGILAYLSTISGVDTLTAVSDRLSTIYGHDVAAEAIGLDGRLQLWKGSFAVMTASPVFGYGIDGARDVMFKLAYWSGSTHNAFLDLGIDGGIFSLCFFVAGLAYVLRACMEAASTVRSQLLLVFIYMFVIAWTGITFSFPSFFGLLVLVFLFFVASDAATDLQVGAGPDVLAKERLGTGRRFTKGGQAMIYTEPKGIKKLHDRPSY